VLAGASAAAPQIRLQVLAAFLAISQRNDAVFSAVAVQSALGSATESRARLCKRPKTCSQSPGSAHEEERECSVRHQELG
jgi:hypothetical protein